MYSFEHQSTPEKWMPLRVLKYIINIMEEDVKKTKEKTLPIVYPMIFYTGAKTYRYSTRFLDLFKDHSHIIEDIFLKPIELVDLNRVNENTLRENLWYGLMGLIIKRAQTFPVVELIRTIKKLIIKVEQEGGIHYIETLLQYIYYVADVGDLGDMAENIKKVLSNDTKEGAMTTLAQYFREEGMQKGIREGIREGIQEGIRCGKRETAKNLLFLGLTIEKIVQATSLSKEEIESL